MASQGMGWQWCKTHTYTDTRNVTQWHPHRQIALGGCRYVAVLILTTSTLNQHFRRNDYVAATQCTSACQCGYISKGKDPYREERGYMWHAKCVMVVGGRQTGASFTNKLVHWDFHNTNHPQGLQRTGPKKEHICGGKMPCWCQGS